VWNGIGGNIVVTSLAGLGLAPLADYGGPTATIALLPGSPAIGAGTAPGQIVTDQRGFALDSPRPDIGAFQAVSVPLAVAVATDGPGTPSAALDLRGAIDLADVQSGAAAITFDATAFAAAQTIVLTSGPLMVTGTETSITVNGPAAGLTIAGGNGGCLQVGAGASATLAGLTIAGGSAALGGGLFNAGTVTLTSCTIAGNSAGTGGGLYNRGTATLTGCTISGNSATSGGGLANAGTLTLTECTVSGNSGSTQGGGLFNTSRAYLTACTVSGNSSQVGGGLYEGAAGSNRATLGDTIVAGNARTGGSPSDIGGLDATNVGGTYNLIGKGGSGGITGGTGGNIVLTGNAAPGLAPLGNYGGATQTCPLLPGCPAIDAGSNSLIPAGLNTDQRGLARIVNGTVDIGAVESQGFTLTAATGSTPQSTPPGAAFADPLAVTVTANDPTEPVAGGVVTFTVNPNGGAGATLSAGSATIAAGGSAQVTANANANAGTYSVTASAAGAAPIRFALSNQGQIGFSGLADQSIVYGTASVTFSETIAAGSQTVPAGENIAVTLDGVTQQATIAADGSFSTTFNATAGLGVAGSPYTVTYSYAGDATHSPINQTSKLTVTKAAPRLNVSDAGGTYNGAPFPAVATVAGVDGHAGSTLDGAGLTLSYYAGSTATGTPLGGPPSGAGAYTASAAFPGSADYGAQTAQVTFAIARATPTITWAAPGSIAYGTALSATQLDATSNVPGSFAYNPASETVLKAGIQTLATTFTPTDSADYTTATASVTIDVLKATPALTWPAPASIVYGTPLGSTQLDATANVPGTFAYTPAAGTTLGAGSHTLTATFTPTDTADYNSATATTTITVTQATPVITWAAPASIVYGTLLGATQLDATTAVPGNFAYTPASGTVLGAGSHTLTATFTPTDATDFATATATVTIVVTQATPTITWAAPAPFVYGTPLSATQLDATASTQGSFSYTPAAGTILGAGSHTLSATFTPNDSTDFKTATASVTLTVLQATPALTWPAPASIVYGTPLGSTRLDATATIPGTFAYTPAAGTLLAAGSHTLSVTFTPKDSTDYATATATVTIGVTRAAPTVAVTGGGTYGGAPILATATVAGVVAGVDSAPAASLEGVAPALIYYADGSALSGPPAAAGTYTVVAAFPGSSDYAAATAQATFAIAQAAPAITWAAPAGIVYGTALGDGQLNANANVPGSVAYSPPAGTVLGAGVHMLSVTFTPNDSADYTTATATVTIAVSQATPAISWNPTASIVYGTPLGAGQFNATAKIQGTLTYTPASGTVLGVGSHTLTAVFTPTDTADYTTATASTTITVTQATPAITWADPTSIIYGTPLGAAQLDATANIPGTFTYSPAAGAILGAGSRTLSVSFTPNDATDYATATATVTIGVARAAPTVAVAGGGTYDGAPIPATATVAGVVAGLDSSPAASLEGVAPALTYYAGGAELSGAPTAAGTYTVVAAFPGSPDYAAATAQATFTIAQAASSLTWPAPAPIVFGTPLGDAQLDATANVPGHFVYTPAKGTILGAGTQTLSVTFTPTDPVANSPATASVSITITPAVPKITWAAPASIVYGTPLSDAQLDANANLPGTYAYAPDRGKILNAGSQTLAVTFTPTDSTDYATVTATTTIVVTQATPTITWPAPAPIVYGTVLDGSQLNATASVLGTFTYTPAAGNILRVGLHTLTATFTPSDPVDDTSATATTTISVSQATPAITWNAPAPIVFGTALGPSQLNATANVPGSFAYSPAAGTLLGVGSHPVSVTFTPTDTTDESSAAAATIIIVTKAAPTIGASDGGGVYTGSPFPATVTVTGIGGTPAPSLEGIGPILTYYKGSTATGPPLPGPPTAAGTYTVVAAFPGSPDYSAASSPPVSFNITMPAATVALTSSAGSMVFGQSVTLTATVSPAGPVDVTPTGTITFDDAGTALASVPLDASGHAVLTLTDLGPGGHSITAIYGGDALFSGGRSGSLAESVSPAATQIVLVPHATRKGKKITSIGLTAEVEPLAPGGGVPTGVVTFRIKNKPLGTSALIGGQVTLAVRPTSVLNKSITISYGGAAEFRPASLTAPKLTSRSLAILSRPLLRWPRARPALAHQPPKRPSFRFAAEPGTIPPAVTLTL
jgi:hypothetical protein